MILDCDKASRFELGRGWVVFDMTNGGVVAHDERDDDGWAWHKAANALAEALTDIERTINNTHPQQFRTDKG